MYITRWNEIIALSSISSSCPMTRFGDRVIVQLSPWANPHHRSQSCAHIWIESWRNIHICLACVGHIILALFKDRWALILSRCTFRHDRWLQSRKCPNLRYRVFTALNILPVVSTYVKISLKPVQICFSVEISTGESLEAPTHGVTRKVLCSRRWTKGVYLCRWTFD